MQAETKKERPRYSIDELSEVTGLSIESIYNGVRKGQIPHLRVGRRIIFPRVLTDRWLRGEAVQTH